jgi:CheY-like chemotaxis protein
MKGDSERCLNAGMDAYLSKPIRADELYKMVVSVGALATEPQRGNTLSETLVEGGFIAE